MTIHERVREAGDAKARQVAQKPASPGADHQPDREAMYSRALDPNSDWPEPALKGERLEETLKSWLPSPPTSPSGSSKGRHKKKSAGADHAGPGGGKRLPVAGVRGGEEARDEPNDVNHDVGELMAKTTSPHGHSHTARDVSSGFGDLGPGR